MKAKVWIVAGLLVIAFAVMITPVMAVDNQPISVSGTNPETVTFTVAPSSYTFLTFNLNTNNTLGFTSTGHPIVSISTNDASWSITAVNTSTANAGHMQNSDGSLYLANATGIAAHPSTYNVAGVAVPAAVGSNLISLSESPQEIITGSEPVATLTPITPLEIDQYVSTGDAASIYSIVITLAYQPTI